MTDILEKDGQLEAQKHGVVLSRGSLRIPRFTTDCYGPVHTMKDLIEQRSHDYIRRLMLEKDGLWEEAKKLKNWSYDSYVLNLAKLELVKKKQ